MLKGAAWVILGLSLGLTACGDGNLLEVLADDDSREAIIEEAQHALDRGNCQKAINGFSDIFENSPDDLAIRISLAAAYTCRAGFNVTELIRISADFVFSGKSSTAFNLFSTLASEAVVLVSDTWDQDTQFAVDLLTDSNLPDTASCSPPPFGNDPDAAFNEGIVLIIRAVMAVASLQNFATGIIFGGDVTPEVAALVGDALRDSSRAISCADSLVGGGAIVETTIGEVIQDLHQAANGFDGNLNNTLTVDELISVLDDQGFELL